MTGASGGRGEGVFYRIGRDHADGTCRGQGRFRVVRGSCLRNNFGGVPPPPPPMAGNPVQDPRRKIRFPHPKRVTLAGIALGGGPGGRPREASWNPLGPKVREGVENGGKRPRLAC
jgi:hypothetical protein